MYNVLVSSDDIHENNCPGKEVGGQYMWRIQNAYLVEYHEQYMCDIFFVGELEYLFGE